MGGTCRGGGLIRSCSGQLEPAGVPRALPVGRLAWRHRHKELRGTIRAQALGILLLPVHYKWDHTPPGKHISLCSTQLEIYENVSNREDCRKVWPTWKGGQHEKCRHSQVMQPSASW